MKPLISYEVLFAYAALLFAGIATVWALYELVQWMKLPRRPTLLPAPRMDRIARGGHDAWVLSEPRIIDTRK